MTHPTEVLTHKLDHMLVLVDAFDGDLMREEELRRRTPDYDVLHHLALEPGRRERILVIDVKILHSLGLLVVNTLGGREEVVHAHDGHCLITRVLRVSTLLAESLALDALTAP